MLLNKKINFNKKETESKMENPSHSFKEANLVFLLIHESQIKSKNVMSWSSRKKTKGHILYRLFLLIGTSLRFVFYFNVWCIEYTLRL